MKHLKNIAVVLFISVIITFGFDFFLGGINNSIETIALNILYGVIIGGSISLSGFISRFVLNRIDSSSQPIKTYVVLLISVTLYISFAVFFTNAIWAKFVLGYNLSSFFTNPGTLIVSVITIFIGLIIYFIILSKNYFGKLLEAEKEIQEANAQSAKFQYDLLKSQVNPHFLFNSLNILSSLIQKNPVKAEEYTITLARIYSYILEHQDDDVVTVNEEIDFVKKYALLQSIRFDNNFNLKINFLEDKKTNKYIVPMTMQLLLENVFKHNIISSEKKMLVTINITDTKIEILNIITKKTQSSSYNIGLNTIKKRYKVLSSTEIIISDNKTEFKVEIPLLSLEK